MDEEKLLAEAAEYGFELSVKEDLEKISEFKIPPSENCWEEQTSVEVFFVKDWGKGLALKNIELEDPTSFRIYMEYIFDAKDDVDAPPGGPYYTFEWHMSGAELLVMFTTKALNV